MLVLIYQVLKTHKPFTDRHAPPLDERQKQRMIRHHIRRLGKLGIAVSRSIVVAPEGNKRSRRCRSRLATNDPASD